ncbi:hypothetical protein CTEN210_00610 [Chaetoceros tenuissimus]|uniref:HMG box domain-containing protein n=1 Tax=Chaetoceros tenuissimus TaxID=426638 RepID=A0AAD3CG11_9STRA|nr:hypothetical protein CTEN210_00610 [Chaetoceros tenuissimus]
MSEQENQEPIPTEQEKVPEEGSEAKEEDTAMQEEEEVVETNDMATEEKEESVEGEAEEEMDDSEQVSEENKTQHEDTANDKDETVGDETEEEPEADEEMEIPSHPPKRPLTAYFLFMEEQRPIVKEENPGARIGELTKIIGSKWKELDEESKVVYVEQANKAKEVYLKQLALYKKHHPNAVLDSESKKKSGDEFELTFPLARIRKIARLDPEVNGISKEAATLLTYAAELFTEKMGQETYSMAQIQKRRKLILQDVVDVTSMKDKFHFLKEDMNDFVKQYKAKELEDNEGNGNVVKKQKVMSEKALSAVSNTKPLTSFFQKK